MSIAVKGTDGAMSMHCRHEVAEALEACHPNSTTTKSLLAEIDRITSTGQVPLLVDHGRDEAGAAHFSVTIFRHAGAA